MSANRMAAEMHGYAPNELLNLNIADLDASEDAKTHSRVHEDNAGGKMDQGGDSPQKERRHAFSRWKYRQACSTLLTANTSWPLIEISPVAVSQRKL